MGPQPLAHEVTAPSTCIRLQPSLHLVSLRGQHCGDHAIARGPDVDAHLEAAEAWLTSERVAAAAAVREEAEAVAVAVAEAAAEAEAEAVAEAEAEAVAVAVAEEEAVAVAVAEEEAVALTLSVSMMSTGSSFSTASPTPHSTSPTSPTTPSASGRPHCGMSSVHVVEAHRRRSMGGPRLCMSTTCLRISTARSMRRRVGRRRTWLRQPRCSRQRRLGKDPGLALSWRTSEGW